MKKIFTLIITTFIIACIITPIQLLAQAPQKMSYQAVIRDANNNLITNQIVSTQVSILKNSASGSAVYVETHTPTTNINGLVSVEIGTGEIISGDFTSIDWADDSYFIKTETDPNGGTNYTITGTSQLLSVPYALHAKTAERITNPIDETDPVFMASIAHAITVEDTTVWSNKLSDYSEEDPVFELSVANKITAIDTVNWNNKLEVELDDDITNELQVLRISNDTIYLSNGGFVTLPTETDPIFNTTVAAEISTTDIDNWNSKTTFSGDYNDLINQPSSANIDSSYIVELLTVDEDYIDFGTFENFTNNGSWAIIERVQMPLGTGTEGGWHFFRGKAWADKEGDIALQITTSQIYAWCQKSGWKSIVYDHEFIEEQWYDIVLQYNVSTQTLELYVDGALAGQLANVDPQDDSANTNKLFWGGQDVAPEKEVGDLYSEASIVIAHQAWFQRILTLSEIEMYQGYVEPDPAFFFNSNINSNSVLDASGNDIDGLNGNTPDYIIQISDNGTEINEPLSVNDDLQVTGDLTVDGNITGNVVIETIHVSQISGLLGQGFTLNFPVILDNLVELEIEGLSISEKVVMISGLGHETERIEGYANGHVAFEAGPSMEYPLIFETTSQQDADDITWWFNNEPIVSRSSMLTIKNLSGVGTGIWTMINYIIAGVDEGVDGRTRFTLVSSNLPDNILDCTYDGINGTELSFNPETDKLVEIEGVSHPYFSPMVELDEGNHTLTITYDYNEGGDIYTWAKNFSTGADESKRAISVINTVDGDPTQEINRYNHFECFPIKFEHFYGFGLNTKLKSRIVISYEFREEG